MARPKLRLDLSTAEDKENHSVVKDLRRKPSTDVVAVRELQAFQTQVQCHRLVNCAPDLFDPCYVSPSRFQLYVCKLRLIAIDLPEYLADVSRSPRTAYNVSADLDLVSDASVPPMCRTIYRSW